MPEVDSSFVLTFPGYRIERLIAQGGFGTLVKALRQEDNLSVAIKVAHAGNPLAEFQLAREAEALYTLGAPLVPALYEVGSLEEGRPFLAMEYIALPTLAEHLGRLSGPLAPAEFASRARTLLHGLCLVHAQGFVHCDLKPENIFLDDAASRVRLFDFGLAHPLGPPSASTELTLSGHGAYAGTAEYMAPEQCAGTQAVDARTDVYALGVILYEMLTGRPPFFGTPAEVFQAHLSLRPPRPSEFAPVAPDVEELVLQCLAKERSRRFPSMMAASDALREALTHDTPRVSALPRPPSSAAEEPSRAAQTRRSVAVLLFHSSANPLAVQKALATCGGQVAFREGSRFAGVFDPDAGENPVRRALRAAEALEEHRLAASVLVDVATVTVQRRPGSAPRYFGGPFSQKERYPTGAGTPPLMVTTAAAEAVPDVRCVSIPDREGLLRPAEPEVAPRADMTVLKLGSELLIGRGEELEGFWQSAQEAVNDGAPTLATMLGERGYGKSHFSAALTRKLQQTLPQAHVYELRAREPVRGDPDGTLRMLLRCALHDFERDDTGSEGASRTAFFKRLGPTLATELWPGVSTTLGWSTPDSPEVQSRAAAPGALRTLAMRATGELLAATARLHPLCLLLDDAHFAEETALDALEYACLAEGRAPLWVCVLARPEFERSRPSWGSRAARKYSLTLGPLSPVHAQALCRVLLRPVQNVPAMAVERIVERTRRVPLFLVELVRGLKRQGLMRQRGPGGSWYLVTDELDRVPELRLVEWLADRELGVLPPALAAHARLCALLGSDFTLATAEGVVRELEREGGAADFPLDPRHATRRLLDLGLLVGHRQDDLSFRNELVREAAARTLPDAERIRIHRAAVAFYQSPAAAPERQRLPRLAFHAAAAGLRDEAVALYLDLAESARGRHAYLDAESMYTRALELVDPADELRGLTALRGRGLMRYRIGRYDDSLADFARAREMAHRQGDARVEVEVLLEEAVALDWVNDYTRSDECVQKARALADAVPASHIQAHLLLGIGRSWFRQGRWERACPPLEAAVDRSRTQGDAGYETRVAAQLLLAVILPNLGRIDEAEAVLEEVISACARRGDRFHLGGAINNRRNLWVARKDLEHALKDQERFMHLGRELGVVGWEYFAEYNLGELLYQAGNTTAATPHIARAIELERGHPEVASQPWALLLQARALAWEGQADPAREVLEQVSEALTARQPPQELSPSEAVLFAMVELATRQASAEEWMALQARSAEVSVEQEPLEVLELMALSALRRGEQPLAVRVLQEALLRAGSIPNVMEGRLRRTLERALNLGVESIPALPGRR
ncbi:serine/threonine-protein kinase PknK [Stigmatella erecta]|uniref:Serine/threonine protein kinase n=1 Tax=Stigmatella erecta TaxID=83460 RepID=A0A1I0H9B3_9BACT|nr:serine/threonine-protein kinase [Stigmatella erecta]SET80291.1 Serine/threonine protein kinase [Stigmatella erecta]